MPDGATGADRLCRCGEPLVDDADGRRVTIGDFTFPFSRSTDFVVCRRCEQQVPVERVHPLGEPFTRELHALTVDAGASRTQPPDA